LLNSQQELAIRLSAFVGVLLMMAAAETIAPRRAWLLPRGRRWGLHLSLLVWNTLLARLLIPVSAVGAALIAESQSLGLLNRLNWPDWSEILVAMLLLDLTIYGQHVLFHHVPFLWQLHLVHHADLDFDVTTGLRFHILEILLSALIKLVAVVLLGAPALAVVGFEVILNAGSMFSHGNIQLPDWLDRKLRWCLVTSEMHRVHHSVLREETNSNFGFNLPWWDYLFRTYRAQPRDGHLAMTIGLAEYRDARQVARFGSILRLPWQSPRAVLPVSDQSE